MGFIPTSIKVSKTTNLVCLFFKWLKPTGLIFLSFGLWIQTPTAKANRGKELFRLCVKCHGSAGEGQQQLSAPAIAGMPEWYLTDQLKKFKSGIRGNHAKDFPGLKMRPIAKMLRYKGDIEAVAKYVSGLKLVKPPQTITDGDAAIGATLYQNCISCHGSKGEGMQPLNSPPLVGQSDWYLMTQLHNFKNGLRGADSEKDPNGSLMVSMANTLADKKAMRDVLAHIYTLQ